MKTWDVIQRSRYLTADEERELGRRWARADKRRLHTILATRVPRFALADFVRSPDVSARLGSISDAARAAVLTATTAVHFSSYLSDADLEALLDPWRTVVGW